MIIFMGTGTKINNVGARFRLMLWLGLRLSPMQHPNQDVPKNWRFRYSPRCPLCAFRTVFEYLLGQVVNQSVCIRHPRISYVCMFQDFTINSCIWQFEAWLYTELPGCIKAACQGTRTEDLWDAGGTEQLVWISWRLVDVVHGTSCT